MHKEIGFVILLNEKISRLLCSQETYGLNRLHVCIQSFFFLNYIIRSLGEVVSNYFGCWIKTITMRNPARGEIGVTRAHYTATV